MAQIEFVNLADIGGDDLGDELNGRFNALKAISNLGVHLRGNYDPLFNYKLNDVVKYNGSLWRVLADSLGVTPIEGASWTEFVGPVTAIPATRIANGTVDNTEFQYLNGVTSAIQTQIDTKASTATLTAHTANTSNPHSVTKTQVGLGNVDNTSDANKPVSIATQTALDTKIPLSQKGAVSGVAELDINGLLPIERIPASLLGGLRFQGVWNAATNSPAILAASAANKGYYYRVSVSGGTTIDGESDWDAGDWIVSEGDVWKKIDGTDAVTDDSNLPTLDPTSAGAASLLRTVITNLHALVVGVIDDLADFTSSVTSSLSYKAPLNNPVFTGVPAGPTASPGTNTTQLATTAFVAAADATLTGLLDHGHFEFCYSGKPLSSESLHIVVPFNCTLPTGMARSLGRARTAATASSTFDVQKNGASIASTNFAAAASSSTHTLASGVALAEGDILSVIGQASPDATLAGVCIMLKVTI